MDTSLPLSTPAQAVCALYCLEKARDNALLAHYRRHEGPGTLTHHLEQLREAFSDAASRLGYRLTPIQAEVAAAPVSGTTKDDDTISQGGGESHMPSPVPAAEAVS